MMLMIIAIEGLCQVTYVNITENILLETAGPSNSWMVSRGIIRIGHKSYGKCSKF